MSPQLSGFRPQSLKLLGHLSTTSDENRWRMTAQRAGLHEGLAPQCSGSGSEWGEVLAWGGPGLPATARNAWGVLRLKPEAKANEVGAVLTKQGFNAPWATSAELQSRE